MLIMNVGNINKESIKNSIKEKNNKKKQMMNRIALTYTPD